MSYFDRLNQRKSNKQELDDIEYQKRVLHIEKLLHEAKMASDNATNERKFAEMMSKLTQEYNSLKEVTLKNENVLREIGYARKELAMDTRNMEQNYRDYEFNKKLTDFDFAKKTFDLDQREKSFQLSQREGELNTSLRLLEIKGEIQNLQQKEISFNQQQMSANYDQLMERYKLSDQIVDLNEYKKNALEDAEEARQRGIEERSRNLKAIISEGNQENGKKSSSSSLFGSLKRFIGGDFLAGSSNENDES